MFAELAHTRDGMTHLVAEMSGVARRVLVDDHDPMVGRTVPDLELDDGRALRDVFTSGGFVFVGPTPTDVLAPWAAHVQVVTCRDHDALLARPDGVIVWTSANSGDHGLREALTRWIGPSDRPRPAR